MPKMKRVLADADAKEMHIDLSALIGKYQPRGEDTKHRLLAIAAYMVGQIIALQDQRTTTPEMALKLVQENIEAGNAAAITDVALGRIDRGPR